MGGRAGGGARGGGGGTSDAAIARMAKEWVPGSAINPVNEPQLLSGEILVTQSGGSWTNARIGEVEAEIGKVTSSAPKQGKGAKYIKAYDAYHDRYMAAMSKGVAQYKQMIGKTKNPALKSLLAQNIVNKQKYMSEAAGVKSWIHKHFS